MYSDEEVVFSFFRLDQLNSRLEFLLCLLYKTSGVLRYHHVLNTITQYRCVSRATRPRHRSFKRLNSSSLSSCLVCDRALAWSNEIRVRYRYPGFAPRRTAETRCRKSTESRQLAHVFVSARLMIRHGTAVYLAIQTAPLK